jgi:hypothetical protein
MFDAFFKLLPFKKWQDFLIRYHILNCSACLGKLADKDEIRSILISESEVPDVKDMWPGFVSRLNQGISLSERPVRRVWNWGYVAAGAIVTLTAVIWSLRAPPSVSHSLSENFKIKSIEVDGRPAQAFLFKTEDPNTYFVWAERNSEGE